MRTAKAPSIPAARREGLIIQRLADEVLVYDEECHKAHCLNKTAALVWDHCDGRLTAADIAAMLSIELGTHIERDIILLAVNQLSAKHLLAQASTNFSVELPDASRRRMIRQTGLAAIVALPLITSLVAPHATQAATCKPSGAVCSSSAECCSGVCSGTCA